MKRPGVARPGRRVWSGVAMALTGCLLALGLTACEASNLSISWADGDPSKKTVQAGLNGGQTINWSADGNIENCKLVTAAVAGTLTISSTEFSANTKGGSFAATLDHKGGYAETTLRLYCNWPGPFNSTIVLWSNTLKVTTTDPVTATVQGPPGAPVLYGTKIQASSDSFATSSSNACVANDTATSVGTITTVLQLSEEATGIAAGPDGAMWFPYTGSNNARIGRIDMAGNWSTVGQAPFYSVLTSIAAGLDGAMWIGAEGWTATGSPEFVSPSRISRITMDGGLENFDTLADDDFITDITAGPDGAAGPDGGAMWFTNKSQKGRSIGRITLGGVVTEYPMVNAAGGIAAGPDGAMWFTQLGKIGRITTRGSITEYSIPTAFNSPRDIAAGPDGAMWFPAGEGGKGIGRITMAGDVTTMSDMRMLDRFDPARIAAGPDGAMWIADAGHIRRITMAGEVSSWYAVLSSDSVIRDIAAGPDGAMWFVAYDDDAGSTIIRRITTGSVQGSCRLTAVKGQQARVMLKPPSAGQMWLTGPCPASAATFVVRPGDQVDGSGYTSPACLNGFSAMSNVTVPVEQVTPLAVTVSGPISSRGLYGIRVGSADAGGFRPAAEVCASTGSTSCTARVVPGDTVTVGLKSPTDAGMALQGTCPSGATFQITSSSATDVDGYATACPSFTPSDSTTDISVQKVPVQAARGVSVSVSGGTLSITASGQIAPGDLEIAGNASQIKVYVPEEGTGPVTLTPGSGCATSGTGVACQPSGGSFQAITISLMLASFTSGPLAIAVTDTTSIPVTFSGSVDRDEFYSGSGSDTILGYGGNDALFGGEGDDAVFGGDGADGIDGEGGSDTVYGDAGPDDITAEGDGKAPDWINCNNSMPGVVGTNNDPANPPTNDVSFDKGADRITDCGEPGAPGVTTPPALSGTPTVGQNYEASAGVWKGKGLIMSYAWFACPMFDDIVPMSDEEAAGACAQVFAKDGTPGLTYKPQAADKGKFLKLRSTARNNAGFWTVVSTASPAVVLSKR